MSTTYYDPDGSQSIKRRRSTNFRDTYLRNREYGFRPKYGDQSRLHCEMYTSMYPIAKWEYDVVSTDISNPGGIFNLEFSPDGKILAAACEKKSFMLFDPVTQKFITSIKKAHNDCVNCIKFLDSRMLATCSDDTTIALWDVRNLNDSIRVLRGHSNWVKSIEYSIKDNLLVSSGFDGHIYTWDINSYSEEGRVCNNSVFHINGLMRIKILPDSSKMVVCTTGGYILLVHNLDLDTLGTDIEGFKPNMYRLMQLSKTTIPNAAAHTHMFSRNKNRVEFIVDFPRNDDAEIISSIQLHPQGWNVLSRNITTDEQSEWTCIHDIQDINSTEEQDETEEIHSEEANRLEHSLADDPMEGRLHRRTHVVIPRDINNSNSIPPYSVLGPRGNRQADLWEAMMQISGTRIRSLRFLSEGRERVLGTYSGVRIVRSATGLQDQDDLDELSMEEMDNRPPSERLVTVLINRNAPSDLRTRSYFVMNSRDNITRQSRRENGDTLFLVGNRSRRSSYVLNRMNRYQVPIDHKIHKNSDRLTHYIEEANVGKGFIKELCYSNDGRIICSPFSHGVRLLSFSPNCDELSTLMPKSPGIKLHEIGTNVSHSNIVLCTKFSPVHPLLVSGCLAGRIVWYQPRL
ncbi:DDB1- and CUL4-associated factor 10 [Daktulosphaira vitifoliae]|uniref:DDB1- and CUL4-associated factor 10 n=1 Tax=Daktulosphaira vitifoliae TaxID=58002 RepID=UPI0021AABB69|nr:DDB1- and CUL4-associated factor 10 [Daktulosphaira vitifoliae]